ncbi:Cytochrome c-552 [Austwickia sp. TVS 96-490-7B]|uniref:ammonia-forming cytochrome c nitrite reductase subunit c552 n=1 Tax=Austwickia sp. TVS 96-490-7B TaxID=2830843 RepID=UPI001C56E547|nr:ammonia-forming cytochrome c nitrite reductase subunit c552 [Austwickia sp. TVS 96-490-7B]MBW3084824.1 Cytochrome c-552 [Austwickia sp. TVS 96-490-7B]
METETTQEVPRRRRLLWLIVGAVAVVAVVTMGLTALLVNILERKEEAREPYTKVVELDDKTVDPAVWGQNFPIHYDMYKKTVDMKRTRYGGSEAMPRNPSDADPRSVVARSKLESDPRLVTMWAGYAFSKDYREKRGHAYMLEDQRDTKRVTEVKQPGTCLNCHASTYVLQKYQLGEGNLQAGFDKMNKMTYADATAKVQHPVGCIDCHDPKTMKLRITRPAFINAMRDLKASQGVKDYDVNTMATAQEMRSFVCGQCHTEYYFKGEGKTLTFPWKAGMKVEDELKYLEDEKFVDWTHKVTGTKMLKAQHPEFEMWANGIHSKAGVSCADCHMPYSRQGSAKVSDHQVRSPMLNVNKACQSCHKASEDEIKGRVETIQGRFIDAKNMTFDGMIQLVNDIADAQHNGTPGDRIETAQGFHRKASYLIDMVVSENSNGFHAPDYEMSLLNQAANYVRQGEMALAGKPLTTEGQPAPSAASSPSPSASPSSSR